MVHACQLETITTAANTPSRRVTLHERPDRGFSWGRQHCYPDLSGSSAAAARSHSLPSLRNSAATAAPPAVEAAAVRQAIEQANAKQRNAINRGVGTGLVANYADDAVLMFPGEPAWRGRGEIGANGVKLLHSAKFGDMKLNTASVDVAGDYAIETGSVEWTVTPKGGKAMHHKGKYLTVWKKQADGSLKIVRDIGNSDGRPPKT